jgi:prolyl-tRNA synthetase
MADISRMLEEIQNNIFEKARRYRDENLIRLRSKNEFYEYFTPQNREKPEIHGGFALCYWNGDPAIEEQVKNELGVTIRCIPFQEKGENGPCVISGEPGKYQVIFAKAY